MKYWWFRTGFNAGEEVTLISVMSLVEIKFNTKQLLCFMVGQSVWRVKQRVECCCKSRR